MIMVKQSHTKLSLLIAADLWKVNYQTLLITNLKLTIRIAKNEWREKISNQNVMLLGLKIIDWITDAKNARKHLPSQ